MKSMSKFAIPLLTLAISATTAYAQQPRGSDDEQQNRATPQSQQQTQQRSQQPSSQQQSQQAQQSQTQQRSSQQQSQSSSMALEQVIREEPDMLEGKAVTAQNGQELGEIEQIVTKTSDNAVYAVINTESDDQAAVKLSELSIAALMADISEDDLEEQQYRESEFEPVQAQASGQASSQASQTGQQRSQTAQGGQASSTAQTSRSDLPALAQIAMSSPDQLQGKMLLGDDGIELGEVQRIVRSRTDNEYYAVVSASGNMQAVVKLEDMEIGKLSYQGSAQQLQQQQFQESEYRAVGLVQ